MKNNVLSKAIAITFYCMVLAPFTTTTLKAATVTFDYSASITVITDTGNFYGGAVGVGDLITGTIRYEDTLVDSNPSNSNVGLYNGFEYSLTVGPETFVINNSSTRVERFTSTYNMSGSSNEITSAIGNPWVGVPTSFGLNLAKPVFFPFDDTLTTLTANLPTMSGQVSLDYCYLTDPQIPPDSDSFFNACVLPGSSHYIGIRADIVSFSDINPIPLPAAFWLFGTALLGMLSLSKTRLIAAD